MKILFLDVTGELGGAQRALLDLFVSWRELRPGDQLTLVAAGEGPLLARARALGVTAELHALPRGIESIGELNFAPRRLHELVGKIPEFGLYLRDLRRVVDRVGPHVVHSNSLKMHVASRLVARDRPVVWHMRDFVATRAAAPLLRRLARKISGALAISESIARDASETLRISTELVQDAIDTDHFTPGIGDGAWLDCLAGLPPAPSDVVRVGLVATYARWKGHDVYFDAIQRMSKQSVCRFFVVGGPIYKTRGSQWSQEELSELANKCEGQTIGFVPFVSDPRDVYRALDVVVHASTKPEPFGLTVAEAMSTGRAVVSSQSAGVCESLADGVDVMMVPMRDAATLAKVIEKLAQERGLRSALGERARRVAVEQFDRRQLAPALVRAYRSLGIEVS